MTSPQTNETTLRKSFEDLEKDALKEISLEIIRTDLLKSLQDQHAKLRADIENRCCQEIEKGLEEQLQKQFLGAVSSCQAEMSKIISSLVKRAEADIGGLNNTIHQTNDLCHEIQRKYSFRWGTHDSL